jgi:hypothetical protein
MPRRAVLLQSTAGHKVRDDQGYWREVEAFVEAHSAARFTHGLCPECKVALYGDLLAHRTKAADGGGET